MCFEAIQWFSCRCPKSAFIYCQKYLQDDSVNPHLCTNYNFANQHLPCLCPACNQKAFEEQWARQSTLPPFAPFAPITKPEPPPENRNEPTTAPSSPPPPTPPRPQLNNHHHDAITHTPPPNTTPPSSSSNPRAETTPPAHPFASASTAAQATIQWLTPERAFLWQRHQQQQLALQQRRESVWQEQERMLEREGRGR